eukprot:TRINITY_DN5218_c0_g1_i1.p1 TRINITY_DN5218_c0_g1~~TRINITY_DN5218_c0_g1_i1.p1  ORF type:complete len:1028 (-),score=311.03 TRINITY_DN5218_c0_g1_i1:47-3130(-)
MIEDKNNPPKDDMKNGGPHLEHTKENKLSFLNNLDKLVKLKFDKTVSLYKKFKKECLEWKKEKAFLFENSLSYDMQKKLEKEFKREELKKDMVVILDTLFELCMKIVNPYYGLISHTVVVDNMRYENVIYTSSLISWLMEMLELESKEKSKSIVNIFINADLITLITETNEVEKENFDWILSKFKFNTEKLDKYQKKHKTKVSLGHLYSNEQEIDSKKTYHDIFLEQCFNQNQYLFMSITKSPIIDTGKDFVLEEAIGLLDSTFPIEYNGDYIPLILLNFSNIPCSFYSAKYNDKDCFAIVEKIDRVVNKNEKRKALIISEIPFKKDFFFNIPMMGKDEKEIERYNLTKTAKLNVDIMPLLLEFEKKTFESSFYYKFGILYCEEEQLNDEEVSEIYKNNKTTPNFEKFLNLLGEKIYLKDWKDYDGGLDTKDNTMGKYSYYTNYENRNIMFQINTLIKNGKTTKKLIEQNMVNIIFCEKPEFQFSPCIFTSKLNQVFIIISIAKIEMEVVYYRVDVLKKNDVDVITPSLPSPPMFVESSELTKFLLSKLINAERAAMHSKTSIEVLTKARSVLIKNIFSQLNELKSTLSSSPNTHREEFEEIEIEEEKEISEKIWVEQLKGAIFPMISDWKKMEMIGVHRVLKKSQLVFQNSSSGNQFFKLEKGEISLLLNGKNVLKFNSGFFREFTVTGHKVVFVSSANKSEVTVYDMRMMVNHLRKELHFAKYLFMGETIILANIAKIFSQKINKKISHQILLFKVKINILEKLENEKNDSFSNYFDLPKHQVFITSFPCIYVKISKTPGIIYIFENYLCFKGSFFGEFKLEIDMKEIKAIEITKESCITISTSNKQHTFKDLLYAKEVSKLVLNLAQKNQKIQMRKNSYEEENNTDLLSLSLSELDLIMKEFPTRKYEKGDQIITQGKYIDDIYYISSGSCEVNRIEKNQKISKFAQLSKGEVFGEISFLLKEKTIATIVALEDCEIVCINAHRLSLLFDRCAYTAIKFYNFLSGIIRKRITENLKKRMDNYKI